MKSHNAYKYVIVLTTIVERRDFKPCVGTVAGQDVGNTGEVFLSSVHYRGRFIKNTTAEDYTMIDIINAAKKIKAENVSLGYVAGKLEVANDIWNGYLSPSDRLEIMNATNIEGLSTLEKLRACVKTLAAMF